MTDCDISSWFLFLLKLFSIAILLLSKQRMSEDLSCQASSLMHHQEACVESPPAKKQKLETVPTSSEKLEERLNHILKCSVSMLFVICLSQSEAGSKILF